MSAKAQTLADQFEDAVAAFVGVVADVSDAQWQTVCPAEQRTVGVLARHVAFGMPFEMDVFRLIAAGAQPDTITRADLDEMNARHAQEWVASCQADTLDLLRRNAAAVAAEVRCLSDEQLARPGRYIEHSCRSRNILCAMSRGPSSNATATR
jgi:hypothetical protein